jgi:hypothetical protein
MRSAWLYLLFFFVSSVSFSQQTVTKDPTAMAIVQKSLAAMGSGQNFVDVQAVGTTTVYGDSAVSYPITLQATGTASIQSVISKPSGTRTYVTDGTNVCADNTLVDLSPDASPALAFRRIDFVPALTILNDYADPNLQVSYVRVDTLNGAAVDVIAIGFAPPGVVADTNPIPQWFFFIDRATLLVSKIQMTNTIPSASPQGPTVEVVFSQYQAVSGFAVPMDQATYVNGALSQDLQLTSVAFNNGLDSSLFAMTCEVPNAQ